MFLIRVYWRSFAVNNSDFKIPEPDFVPMVLDLDGSLELRAETRKAFVFARSDELHQGGTFQFVSSWNREHTRPACAPQNELNRSD
jgi:hypothetical protein